nr:MAG TPA: fibrinogen alpha chain [Caudoviricetes sp.]
MSALFSYCLTLSSYSNYCPTTSQILNFLARYAYSYLLLS